jgi:hypothetical protein
MGPVAPQKIGSQKIEKITILAKGVSNSRSNAILGVGVCETGPAPTHRCRGRSQSFAKYSPTMLLTHFVGDTRSR